MSETNDVGKYKGKFLLEEPPLMLQPTLAQMVGQNEAQFLQLVHYLSHNPFYDQHLNAKVEIKLHEGRLWVKIPPILLLDKRRGRLKFMSESTWKRTVASCKNQRILFTADLNEDKRDNTNWYSLDLDEMARQETAHIRKIEREYSGNFTLEISSESSIESATDGQCQNDTVAGSPNMQCQNEPAGSVKMAPSGSVKMAPSGSVNLTQCTERKEKTEKQQQEKQIVDVVEDFSNPEFASSNSNDSTLIEELAKAGISQATARDLAAKVPDMARAQLDWWPWRKGEVNSWSGGTLRRTIEQGWAKPQSLQTHEDAQDAKERAAHEAEEWERGSQERNARAEEEAAEQQKEYERMNRERAALDEEYAAAPEYVRHEIDTQVESVVDARNTPRGSTRWNTERQRVIRNRREQAILANESQAVRVLEAEKLRIENEREQGIAAQKNALHSQPAAIDDPLKNFALDAKAQDRVLGQLVNGELKAFDEKLNTVAQSVGTNLKTAKPSLVLSLRRLAVIELAKKGAIKIV